MASPVVADNIAVSKRFLSHDPRLCARLLTATAAGDAAAIQAVVDTYIELLTGPGAELVSPEELRAMLDSGRFFDLPEGSSARDHLRDGLRELESAGRRGVRDQAALMAGIRVRLAAIVEGAVGAEERARPDRKSRGAVSPLSREIRIPGPEFAHSLLVNAVAPNGSRALLEQTSRKGWIRFWIADLSPGSSAPPLHLSRYDNPSENNFYDFSFSDDGRVLAFRSGEELRVLDAATGGELRAFDGDGVVRDYKISPDGRLVAFLAIRDGGWHWYLGELATGEEKELPLPAQFLEALERLATLIPDFHERKGRVSHRLEIAPDGSALALVFRIFKDKDRQGASNTFVIAWSLPSGRFLDRYRRYSTNAIGSLVFSPDASRELIIQPDGFHGRDAVVRDLKTHGTLFAIQDASNIHWPAFSPDSRYLAAGYAIPIGQGLSGEYAVRLWDATTGAVIHPRLAELPGISGTSDVGLFFSEGGSLLNIVHHDGRSRRVIRVANGHEVSRFDGAPRTQAYFSRDGGVRLTADGDRLSVVYVDEILGMERSGK